MGLELELRAPPGRTRLHVARALARAVGGRVEYGFKYHSEGALPDGRPLCQLTLAARVVVAGGRVLLSVVDDPTLREGLPEAPRSRSLAATDDLRLALLAERTCWSARESLTARLEPLRALFAGHLESAGLVDAYGHRVVVLAEQAVSRARACEVVTAPLRTGRERRDVVEAVLGVARRLRLVVPHEAALHAHYDAGPWQSTGALRRLILESSRHHEAWRARLRPNPACTKLGPFPDDVVRVAREGARVPFSTFAAALSLAGAKKACDLNLLGVIEPRPKQPTLEVRCLPMSLEPAAVLASLAEVEALLATCLPRR